MTPSSYNYLLGTTAHSGFISLPLLLALAIAEWGVYLVPTSLLALWVSGGRETRITSLKAVVTMAAAVIVSKMIALLWTATQPAVDDGGYIYLPQGEYFLTPSVTIAIILATGLTLWTARAIKIKWVGVLLVMLSLAVSWAKVFLGMHYPLDIFGAGLISLAMMLAMNSKYGKVVSDGAIRFINSRLQNLSLLSELSHLFPAPAAWLKPGYRHGGQRVTLLSCLQHSPRGLSYFAKRIKLSARTLLHYRQTRRWLAYWNGSPMHASLAQATPRLLQKIYRPYQSLRLRSAERMDLLVSHYNFIVQQGLATLILQAAKSPQLLGSFSGKSGVLYEIRLSAIATLDREGELALDLCCAQQRLFSVAFTFHGNEASPAIGIGCLQGPRGSDAQERVRHATRDMFGMRPKGLMVRLVREIGRAYGCKQLILVGNRNRVMSHQVRTGQVFADYDDFWQEIGAMRRADGEYQLSCEEIPSPNLQEIPSSKRSEARKRIDLTERAVQAALEGFSGRFARA
ncbi:DUF535 family protein [Collimonas pratensis]|uniref:Phosphatidic acid phosphatase type 2/haloperoxidase domain-containing protein n=1 Tax=Collimonas pratensis TaxID=279113 RepID=A0ABM5ZC61_9BURK|nr:DUF535 family protein [Collimonas pratensis]AMP16855.1 hypothetical protein CPter291_4635 [Collimonas pratensis]